MIELSIIFLLIVVLLTVGIGILLLNKRSESQPFSQSALDGTNFTPTQMYLDKAGGAGIALNESTKTMCVIQSSTLPPRLVHFTDLLAVFVIKNDTFLHQTLRTFPREYATLAQASLHNLSDAGKTSSQPTPDHQTQKIDLCVAMNDQESPIHIVNFLDMDTKEDGILFNKAMVSAKHWHQLLSDLIQQANQVGVPEENSSSSGHGPQAGSSIAAELEKLSDLLDKKAISQKDFDDAKEKILAHS